MTRIGPELTHSVPLTFLAAPALTLSACEGGGNICTTRRTQSQLTYNRNIPLSSPVTGRAVGTTSIYTIVMQPVAQACSVNEPTGSLAADTQIIVICA